MAAKTALKAKPKMGQEPKQTRLSLATARLKFLGSQGTSFSHDREKTVGASEVGGCLRRTAYKKKGFKQDAGYVDDPGFAMRGNILEDNVSAPLMQLAVSEIGGKLLWAGQKNQTTIIIEDWFASVTPDGLAIDVPNDALADYGVADCGGCFLLELKSIDPRFRLENPKPQHADQVNYGMGLIRADGEYKPKYALLLYVDASSLQLKPFVIEFNQAKFKAQLARAKKIMSCEKPEDLLPEGHMQGGKDCRWCNYFERCTGRKRAEKK